MKYWKVRLLNCVPKEEPNETILLSEFFKMMQLTYPKKIQFRETHIFTKKQFLDALTDGWCNLLHVSAHGKRNNGVSEIHIGNKKDTVTATDIHNLDVDLAIRSVFVSACSTSYKDIATAFDSIGVEHYAAPRTDVEWIDASLFSLMFYKRYIYDNISYGRAFEYTQKRTQTTKDFPYYWV